MLSSEKWKGIIEKILGKNRNMRHLTRRTLAEYILTLALFYCGVIVLLFLAWNLSHCFVWQADNLLYRMLSWVKEYLLLVLGTIFLAGWAFITWHFMSKPLCYLDEIIRASQQLARPGSDPIVLPAALSNIQDQLNLTREKALRNALLAKEAEQRKNDMVVYLAHDLKTPLTSVIGYLSLLSQEPQISPELRAKYTDIALKKAERLEELINEFFDITRFSLTTLTLEPRRINLSRMLEQLVSEFNPILSEKSLSWETDIEPDLEILCDPDKLERVIDNLIRNALNYSYPHTAVLLSLHRASMDGQSVLPAPEGMSDSFDAVRLCVKNHGKTIAPEKLSHIFEQFFRLDSSRSSATGGAGLGLAIAKEIVTLHGGTIRAESESESITFTVLLPAG